MNVCARFQTSHPPTVPQQWEICGLSTCPVLSPCLPSAPGTLSPSADWTRPWCGDRISQAPICTNMLKTVLVSHPSDGWTLFWWGHRISQASNCTNILTVLLVMLPCSEIRKRTKVIDIIEYALKQKWKWAGHRARLKDNRWTKRCTEWQPRRGKRMRGRPSRRWQDDMTEKEGTTWIRKATDRWRLKTLMEGYILQWMDKA